MTPNLETSASTMSFAAFVAQQAVDHGPLAALTCGEESRTWEELERGTNRLAHAFLASGARPGSFVAIMLPNGIAFIEACLAVNKLGATPQLLAYRSPDDERAFLLDLVQPSLVVAHDGSLANEFPAFLMLPDAASAYPYTPVAEAEPVGWMSVASGGSTGKPKVVVTDDPAIVGDPRYAAITTSALAFGYRPGMTLLVPGPLYHAGPFIMAMSGLMIGGHLVIMKRFDPLETLQEVERRKATHLFLVPTMMGRIWKLGEEQRSAVDISSLEAVWRGAALCPPWLAQAWIDWLGPTRIWDLYGASDGSAACRIRGDDWLARKGSAGQVCFGSIEIRDEDNTAVPPGTVGTIFMRRPEHIMRRRYIGAPQIETPDRWRTVGDMGHIDDDGFLFVADRRTDLIISGGINIYPAEIEAAIEEHDAVDAAVVVGLDDEDMGKAIHAVVQCSKPLTDAQLRQYLEGHLARNKIPRGFTFTTTSLRNEAGKVRRQDILQTIQAEHAARSVA